jgi:peptide/nickel transport system ATP-binding protein
MPTPIMKVTDLKKWFPVRLGFFETLFSRKELYVKAIDGIDFEINKKEIFGLAGESGSGKTTTGRVLLRLTEPTTGKIMFQGKDITNASEEELKKLRRKMQIIFQDPYESINPRMTIFDIIAEPLRVQKLAAGTELEEKVYKALESVELVPPDEFVWRFPHELSGGQRQRVATGRALIVNPDFIVADEPVSMLDVSIRAEILNLMFDLMEKYEVTFLYITHDLALARHICNRLAVMYLGKLMEKGPAEKIVFEPLHPYTKALISAVPDPDPSGKRIETVIKGEIPNPVNPPSGCRFHTRCPQYIGNICKEKEPELLEVEKEHFVACHLYH